MNIENRCSRCGEGRLLNWSELDEEQREVVRRLPESANYTLAERQAMFRWCPRCWFEAPANETTDA